MKRQVCAADASIASTYAHIRWRSEEGDAIAHNGLERVRANRLGRGLTLQLLLDGCYAYRLHVHTTKGQAHTLIETVLDLDESDGVQKGGVRGGTAHTLKRGTTGGEWARNGDLGNQLVGAAL